MVSARCCARCHYEYNCVIVLSTTILARKEKKPKEHLYSPFHTAIFAPLVSFCNSLGVLFLFFLFTSFLNIIISLFPAFLFFCFCFFYVTRFCLPRCYIAAPINMSFILGMKDLWIQYSDICVKIIKKYNMIFFCHYHIVFSLKMLPSNMC